MGERSELRGPIRTQDHATKWCKHTARPMYIDASPAAAAAAVAERFLANGVSSSLCDA